MKISGYTYNYSIFLDVNQSEKSYFHLFLSIKL